MEDRETPQMHKYGESKQKCMFLKALLTTPMMVMKTEMDIF